MRIVLDDQQQRIAGLDIQPVVRDLLDIALGRRRQQRDRPSHRTGRIVARPGAAGRADIFERQEQRERTADPGCAPQLYLAAEQRRQLAADGKAETGAAVLAAGGGVGLLEGLEDDLLLFLRDADAGVGHFKRHHRRRLVENRVIRVPAPDRSGHVEPHTALRGELEGVGQQIFQNLLEPLGVGHDAAAKVGIEMNLERQLPAVGLVAERPRDHIFF